MKVWTSLILIILSSFSSFSQKKAEDSLAYTSYKKNLILYADFGYNAAPFSIRYPFPNGIDKIKFRHNYKMMLGFGISYKWFSLRIGAALVGNVRPQSRYGKANYFDADFHFTIKKTYSEIDFRYYTGYVIQNAYQWDDSLNEIRPNDVSQNIATYNVAFKMWYLDNKNFRIDPFNGIKGHYNRSVTTWYLAGRLDYYGAGNNSGSLVSPELHDTTNTKVASDAINGVDIGVIPGIGHVNRKGNWQYGFMAALGPRLQIKSYNVNGLNNGLLAIVLRYDLRVVAGYSLPRFFTMFSFEVDNKTINFEKFKYFQSFYGLRLSIGYRFKNKAGKEKV